MDQDEPGGGVQAGVCPQVQGSAARLDHSHQGDRQQGPEGPAHRHTRPQPTQQTNNFF